MTNGCDLKPCINPATKVHDYGPYGLSYYCDEHCCNGCEEI